MNVQKTTELELNMNNVETVKAAEASSYTSLCTSLCMSSFSTIKAAGVEEASAEQIEALVGDIVDNMDDAAVWASAKQDA